METIDRIIDKYHFSSISSRDKGDRFERLMLGYLLTDQQFSALFKSVVLWKDFIGKDDLSTVDTGIDLVALKYTGEYVAIQCKCYKRTAYIDKAEVDTFISTSGRSFYDQEGVKRNFSERLWISTTNNWSKTATEVLQNQLIPTTRITLNLLQKAAVNWEKLENGIHGKQARLPRSMFEHQKTALNAANEYFTVQNNSRGKLIMACGTGKTFTALKITESLIQNNGIVLFLVPSITLLAQTLREWTGYSEKKINPICICSDPKVSRVVSKKKLNKFDDTDHLFESTIDLAMPATTDIDKIIKQLSQWNSDQINQKNNVDSYECNKKVDSTIISESVITVLFSTYQSIETIIQVQKQNPELLTIDLIICDEAHRTTGVSLNSMDESYFVKVHSDDNIKAEKRIYMTATPRLYDEQTKKKADLNDASIVSMDDESIYGQEFYKIGFGEAVEKNLLTDYKVLILTVSQEEINPIIYPLLKEGNYELKLDDRLKLVGCLNALSKNIVGDEGIISDYDPDPMKRAVAFCSNISNSKETSRFINEFISMYKNEIFHNDADEKNKINSTVFLKSDHIDGSMNSYERDFKMNWLKAEPQIKHCNLLTNVRCLTEGVDVPSLDAILFFSPKNSQIDVVQSVGRVMRKSEGKKSGYIIIPIVIPSGNFAEEVLDHSDRFKVVWSVLNALRSHDDRFDALINKINLKVKNEKILILNASGNSLKTESKDQIADQLMFDFQKMKETIYAKMVLKVGDRHYWERWARDVASIAQNQILRIKTLIESSREYSVVFDKFLSGIRQIINPAVGREQAIEMLSQHIITKPIFEALFQNYSFVKSNPISIVMQDMLDKLDTGSNAKDFEKLDSFYHSIRLRIEGITDADARQSLIVELYDKFFANAFPKMVEQLGIVYTPVEVVNFMIRSANDILKKEFGRELTDEGVHILEPFAGTGTFITQLLKSGLIKTEDLSRKYKYEIHANEIVLLAYYIASINIESYYQFVTDNTEYMPFEGICLTDTFQLAEDKPDADLFHDVFKSNYDRLEKQKTAPITVIVGNPPYSIGQKSANDNAQNQSYPRIEKRIEETYVKNSTTGLSKSLYDSYLKAFRWSTDRLGNEGGIICFVTNSAWLDSNSGTGFRKTIEKEFSSIYVFNLRGAIRGRSGESAKQEGQNVFDIITGVAITILVKNPFIASGKATIYYNDIGNYLTRKQKLSLITEYKSIDNMIFTQLYPDEHGDWISIRKDIFGSFIPLAPEKKLEANPKSWFKIYSLGIATNRDSWVYNFSKNKLESNVGQMVSFYNQQVDDFKEAQKSMPGITAADFMSYDPKKISWTVNLKESFQKGVLYHTNSSKIIKGLYRPFFTQHLFFDPFLIERPAIGTRLFPNPDLPNKVICVTGVGGSKDFSCIITDCIPDLQLQFNGQCFPLYYYEKIKEKEPTLFNEPSNKDVFVRRAAITDYILHRTQNQYASKMISREDIFYYVYGFLHSPEYRSNFTADFKKMLPRIPLVANEDDFWAFSNAGYKLAELHIHYDKIPPFPDVKITGYEEGFFQVEKMRFLQKNFKSTIIFNEKIMIENIPLKAYEYIINGKSAIEWIMDRYQMITHKESGIINNPNDRAMEYNQPSYILDLLLSIINVSVQTMEIIEGLPNITDEIHVSITGEN